MAETSTTNRNEDMFETPGQVLRLHREKLNLSTQEIAKRIHLDIKIIEAIENDSSEGMPSAIYVRGYLRSYAKTVGADADKVIELYNADSPPPMPEILPEVKPPTQVSSNDKPVKAFTYLITLGLVLLLLIWYQSNFVVDTNVKQVNTKTSINGVDITYAVIHHPDSWQTPVIELEEETKATDIAEPPKQDGLLELEMFNDEQIIEISSSEATNNGSSLSSSGQGPDTINITLTSDSWIEIYDSNDNRMFHDLAQAGKQYNIKGTAPFNVLLGFSAGVKLEFNGKPFNVEPHSKNGVARFTLPE
jgi:cytoskeleton protein RodZ